MNWERHFLEISRSAIFNNLLCLIVGRSNWAFWEKNPQAHLTIIREWPSLNYSKCSKCTLQHCQLISKKKFFQRCFFTLTCILQDSKGRKFNSSFFPLMTINTLTKQLCRWAMDPISPLSITNPSYVEGLCTMLLNTREIKKEIYDQGYDVNHELHMLEAVYLL